MEDQGSGWRGPDADEMDDAGRRCRARGMLTARGSGAGSDFQTRLRRKAVRNSAWPSSAQAGIIVDRSNAEGVVKQGVAACAIVPVRCRTGFARASPGGDAR